MKYIKIYESKSKKPKVGDYVIVKSRYSDYDPNYTQNHQDIFNAFVNSNIGIVIGYKKIDNQWIIIKYKEVPGIISNWFTMDSICAGYNGKGLYVRSFQLREIEGYSKDKEELEVRLAAKKYNI